MFVEIPVIVLGLLKSVLPGIASGILIDVVGSFRGRARSAAAGAVRHVVDLFDGDDEPVRTTAPPPRTPGRTPIDPPIAGLALDPLTLDVLGRAGIKTVGQLRQIDDLQTIAGVGATRADAIAQALKGHA